MYPKRDPQFFDFLRKGLESYNPRHGPNGVILCNPGFSRLKFPVSRCFGSSVISGAAIV